MLGKNIHLTDAIAACSSTLLNRTFHLNTKICIFMSIRTLPHIREHIFCFCGEWEPDFVLLLSLAHYFQNYHGTMCSCSKNDKGRQSTVWLFLRQRKDKQEPHCLHIFNWHEGHEDSAWFSFRNRDQDIALTILVKTKRTAF